MKLCYGCMEEYDDHLTVCPNCGYDENTLPENSMHMEPGSILYNRYVIGKVIGYGGFGVTYIGYDSVLDIKVAIKEYLPSEFSTRVVGQTQVTVFDGDKREQFMDGCSKFVDEAKKLAKFSSFEGIVKIYDSFEYNNTAYIIMELLTGETLSERLKRVDKMTEAEAVAVMLPIISSLEQVHKSGIIHRDIAPDNIFLTDDGQVKLIDFGAARFATTSHSRSLTVIIKPGYSPEEQYRSRGDQGPHTDVYAAAAVLYRMLTGITPPDAMERRAYVEAKKKDTLKEISEIVPDISQNVAVAIMNAMNVRIEDRTRDMSEFKAELISSVPVKRRNGKIRSIDLFRWPLWAKIAVPAAAFFLLLFTVLFTTGIIGFDSHLKTDYEVPDGQTRVPSVINHELLKGEDRLKESKLLLQLQGKISSDLIPGEYILQQDILGGSVVPQNTVVGLTVSAGIPKHNVPNVCGEKIDEARKTLETLGFKVEADEQFNDTLTNGIVMAQSVDAGSELEEGKKVTLSVSKGRDPAKKVDVREIKMPELVGKTLEEAIKEAEKNGLMINIAGRKFSKKYPEGTIIEQTPKAGGKLKTDKPADLVLSMGYQKIEVPDVTLLEEKKAAAQLEALSLKAEVTKQSSETVAAGLVISQTPEPKTKTDPESTVKLIVSTGAATFEMPSLVGLQLEAAKTKLTEKGLQLIITYETNTSKKENEILRQSIKARERVKRGQEITLVVCSHGSTVNVPNLVGKSRSEAEKALKTAGLKYAIYEVYSDTAEKGSVISQSPKGGSSLKKGAAVTLNVSKGRAPSDVEQQTVEQINDSAQQQKTTRSAVESKSVSSSKKAETSSFAPEPTIESKPVISSKAEQKPVQIQSEPESKPEPEPEPEPESEPEPEPNEQYRNAELYDIVEFGGYEWYVIDKRDGELTLLMKDVFTELPYNEKHTNVTWETCTLRDWLNSEFYNSFVDEDRAMILLTHNVNEDYLGLPGGNDTEDYIYLPSIQELEALDINILDDSWCWVRSPNFGQARAALVCRDGLCRISVNYDEGGVRPALNLKY